VGRAGQGRAGQGRAGRIGFNVKKIVKVVVIIIRTSFPMIVLYKSVEYISRP
jgi:hypothetical protein